MSRIVCVFANQNQYSEQIRVMLEKKLQAAGFIVLNEFDPSAELLACVGGDGSFLHTLHKCGFPDTPVIGVNTGHLGFFQEIDPAMIDEFIMKYKKGAYQIQRLKTIRTELSLQDEKAEPRGAYHHAHMSLNEVVLQKAPHGSAHLNISFGDRFVQRFSGDGILVCPPAGSTAYNYALGGSIVDPGFDLMQITPMAPINTTAYRCFTSSLIVPPQVDILICPEFETESNMKIIADGMEHRYDHVRSIRISLTDHTVQLVRFENYDFWSKVKSKFL